MKSEKMAHIPHPFWIMVQKEVTDHVKSWRFLILISIIALTCLGSMYTGLKSFGNTAKHSTDAFFFLKLFTASDGNLPSFFIFIGFLGPLLGIGLGFDAINSEQNKGTLSHILAQPVHRDYIINAKFVSSLLVISIMIFALNFLVLGSGLIAIGIPPTVEEFMRIIAFAIVSIIYIALWLNLSIMLSVRLRQPATSALACIAIWLFFTVFYPMIINLITGSMQPSQYAPDYQVIIFEKFKLALMRFMPNELFSEATTTLLVPEVRSLGPLTMEQVHGTIPGPLSLGQSILLVWPQVVGLFAGTVLCFVFSYLPFMKREIRSK